MEKSSKRGKIPQQDWPSIITRYEAGETLASIARTYDCSPPAISYIVSRTRARTAAAETAGQSASLAASPQLVKASGSEEIPVNEPAADESSHHQPITREIRALDTPSEEMRAVGQSGSAHPNSEARLFPDGPSYSHPPPSNPVRERGPRSEPPTQVQNSGQKQPDATTGNGNAAHPLQDPGAAARHSEAAQNGESRRRLHLSPNSGSYGSEPLHNLPAVPPRGLGSGDQTPLAASGPRQNSGFGSSGGGQASSSIASTGPQTAARIGSSDRHSDREGTFIDEALRERVQGDIAVFLAAFDAALADDSPESRIGLREATDRLLRAGARTRIELERLEARAPLPPREKNGQAPLFRR
jgi:hypothetical protein